MNPGIRRLVRLLAEQIVAEAYDGARATGETSGFSTTSEARERVLTEAANDDSDPDA